MTLLSASLAVYAILAGGLVYCLHSLEKKDARKRKLNERLPRVREFRVRPYSQNVVRMPRGK